MGAGNNEASNQAKKRNSIERQRSITTDEILAAGTSNNTTAATTTTAMARRTSPIATSASSIISASASLATNGVVGSSLVMSSSSNSSLSQKQQEANGVENKSYQNAMTLASTTTTLTAQSPSLATSNSTTLKSDFSSNLTKDDLASTATSAAAATAQQSGVSGDGSGNSNSNGSATNKLQIARRERRPDRAVYVPRARRSQTTPPTTAATMTTTNNIATTAATAAAADTTSVNSLASPNNQKFNSIISSNANSSLAVSTTSSSRADDIISTKKKIKAGKISNTSCNPATESVSTSSTSSFSGVDLHTTNAIPIPIPIPPPSIATFHHNNSEAVPKERKTERVRKLINDDQIKDWLISPNNCDRQHQREREREREQQRENFHKELFENSSNTATSPASTNTTTSTPPPPPPQQPPPHEMNTKTKKQQNQRRHQPLHGSARLWQNGIGGDDNNVPLANSSPPKVENVSKLLIEHIASEAQNQHGHHHHNHHNVNLPPKCDIDEQELQRASKEINRSNRRIIKQTFVSDVLEIPEKIEHDDSSTNLIVATEINPKMLKSSSAAAAIIPSTSSTFDSTTEDEEDDWETKYDESGECLDPKILQELETAVGKVKITKPKTDYSAFLANQSLLNGEEFPHVLEVSNFPVEFKNQDLLMVFSQYKESGFDIKWVDDTHALAVFSSSRVAAEVLTMGHPFVVLKPLAEATMESRLKAKKCASSLQPYKQRPETCAALARRLVTGALGMRLETAAAERENEKRVLRQAKERKLLAAKQRDEAWEN